MYYVFPFLALGSGKKNKPKPSLSDASAVQISNNLNYIYTTCIVPHLAHQVGNSNIKNWTIFLHFFKLFLQELNLEIHFHHA